MATAPRTETARLAALVRAHDRWRGREVFNLLPSENAVSPAARRLLSSDLAGRYTLPREAAADGEAVDNDYGGTKYADAIERLAVEAARRVFRAGFASVRPLSGHIAALSVLAPLLPRGSKMLAVPPGAGGYDGYQPGFVPAVLGYDLRPIPAGGLALPPDAAEVAAEIRREKPSAVVLGQSFFLFPYPLRAIAEEAHARDALVLYDASHVLGLVAGGRFQDPLRDGADVVYGSTHKSFPGPQGGLLVTDREDLFKQIDAALVWRVLDNAHWHRIASLAQTLLELERGGAAYARATVENARALGRALDGEGFPVLAKERGYTESHQVILERTILKERHGVTPAELSRRWEAQRLIADRTGRLGTAEVARWGLTARDMPRIAALLARAGLRDEAVGAEVLRWRRRFRQLRYA